MSFEITGRYADAGHSCVWRFNTSTSRLAYYSQRPGTVVLVTLIAIGLFTGGYFENTTVMWVGVGIFSAETLAYLIIKATSERKKNLDLLCVTQSLGKNVELAPKSRTIVAHQAYTSVREDSLNALKGSYSSSHLLFFPRNHELGVTQFHRIFNTHQFYQSQEEVPGQSESLIGWDIRRFDQLGTGSIVSSWHGVSQKFTSFVLLKDRGVDESKISIETGRLLDQTAMWSRVICAEPIERSTYVGALLVEI